MDTNPITGLLKACCFVLHVLVLIVVTPIAQHILNGTSVSLPYAVMYPCNSPFAELDSDASIQIPGLFGAALQPYNTILSTEGKDPAGRTLKIKIGESLFPEMNLKPGTNPVDFTTGIAIADTTSLLNNFIVPMFVEGKTVKLFIDVQNITLTVLKFIKVPNLKMNKVLVCHGSNTTQPKEIPDKYCKPESVDPLSPASADLGVLEQLTQEMWERRLSRDQGQGYQMVCVVEEGTTVFAVEEGTTIV